MSSDSYYRPRYILTGIPESYERTDDNPLYNDLTHERDHLVDKSFLPNQLPQVDEALVLHLPESRLLDRIFTEPERRRWRGLWNPMDANIKDPDPVQPSRATERLLHLNVYPDGTPKTVQGFTDVPQKIKFQEELNIIDAQIKQINDQIHISPDADKILLKEILQRLEKDKENIQEIVNPNFKMEKLLLGLTESLGKGNIDLLSALGKSSSIEPPAYIFEGETEEVNFNAKLFVEWLNTNKGIIDNVEVANLFSRFTGAKFDDIQDILEEKVDTVRDKRLQNLDPTMEIGDIARFMIEFQIDKADAGLLFSDSGFNVSGEDQKLFDENYDKYLNLITAKGNLGDYIQAGVQDIKKIKSKTRVGNETSEFLERLKFILTNTDLNENQAADMLRKLRRLKTTPSSKKNYPNYATGILWLEFISEFNRRPSMSDIEEFQKVTKKSDLDKLSEQIVDGHAIDLSA